MAKPTKATSLYLPPTNYNSYSEVGFYGAPSETPKVNPQALRSLSPEDVQKMKYKIDLDKQVTEKQERIAREWEKKIERDKKYVQHQPFGRHDRTTVLKKEELEEILSKGRAPSPVLEMPQQYVLHHSPRSQGPPPPPPPPMQVPPPPSQPLSSMQTTSQQQQPAYLAEPYIPSDNNPSNAYITPRQSMYNNYPQYPTYSTSVAQTQLQPSNTSSNTSNNNGNVDFQRFYGSNGNSNIPNGNIAQGGISTAQPIKGDAHDPFLLFDPNKEGQNVFNIIPQQDLYDPWGRPGAGAPLIHTATGQKFTRYSGSLDEKLNHVGPLGFFGKKYAGNLDEQKRELELEQRRRQQEEMEHRSNFAGARTRYRSDDSRMLHDDLVRQAEERARLQKLNRYQNSIAELQHTQAMNNWWGKGGGGAPSVTNRRHNVNSSFENPRQKWVKNHLGQLILTDEEVTNPIKVQTNDYLYPKSKQLSNHRNFYEISDDQAS